MLDLWHYALTRIFTWKVAALILFLNGVLWSTSEWTSFASFVVLTLVLQFRLWDDLADVDIDRHNDPSRVLGQCGSLNHFKLCLLLTSLGAGAFSFFIGLSSFVTWLTNCLILVVWYSLRGDTRGRVNYHIVLLKYPLILVVALGGEFQLMKQWVTLLVCYVVLCVVEAIDEWQKAVKIHERSSELSYAVTPISVGRNGNSK